MNILLAGATGALGLPLTRQLLAAGHRVTGLTRSHSPVLAALGAGQVHGDALDERSVLSAVDGHKFDVVMHQLTALKKAPTRHKDMYATNELRQRGTRTLLAAARATGATRFVTQSIIFGYGYGDVGPVTEETPLAEPGTSKFAPHLAGIRAAEEQIFAAAGIEGVALRYGLFYGGDFASLVPMLRKRALPVASRAARVGWIHHEDAAAATVAAAERGRAGEAYNIVDDVPASWTELIRESATLAGAPAPRVLPPWLVRIAAPYGWSVLGGTSVQASNAKARRELGWAPEYRSYREGLAAAAAAL
ncbi:NAD-dependent epimerase/dehydratase family protein [Longispora albida]|uniref:NAD-dependent epimerase/dehydratase family protein n=1 Tax=Longispora albida TaxID=203523 RepID=UPI000376EAF9|nr:NAD(P)-dependent oxidoreductase [Longispora albida]